ncbi:MAG: Xaa-Pro peptidase family protein [Chloroflexaceae bacterium]|nr:Xaa-Pro peptidase family protein [Chloroflexaceae bacterium]
MQQDRLNRLTAAVQQAGLAGLALMPAANLKYLTGLTFHQGKRLTLVLVPADGSAPCFIIPALELTQAQANATLPMRYFPWHDADGPGEALRQAVQDGFGGTPKGAIGVEYTALRVMELRALEQAAPGLATVDGTPLLASLRMVKDDAEQAAMAEAARMVEVALERVINQMQVGMTERDVSAIITREIMATGATGESFDNIVASGPNSANPHHNNTDRPLQAGDLVILDCGAAYGGYYSDITRTVAMGEPGPEARRIYELVQAANEAGRAAVRPGATGHEVDRAARSVITNGGFGPYFVHRTGHGLGIETHELPDMVAGNHQPLAVGTTFTIEPGIYVPGMGGVRIEDDMVVTEEGGRSFTSFRRELLVLPG